MKLKELSLKTNKSLRYLMYLSSGERSPSASFAAELEQITGISRLKWLYPEEYGNPWDEIGTEADSSAA